MPYTTYEGGIRTFEFGNLAALPGVRHFVSTRHAGVSPTPYQGLNLGYHVGDETENVSRNRRRLTKALGIPMGALTVGEQHHGERVRVVGEHERGCGSMDWPGGLRATDGLVTGVSGVCLMVLVADCTPILLCDPARRVVAAVHAGWRGTVARIAERAVAQMIEELGCRGRDIRAGIGPSIGPQSYEIGSDVADLVMRELPEDAEVALRHRTDGRATLDLWTLNHRQLVRAGLVSDNIEIAGICTLRNPDDYFSARRDGPATGRFGAGIVLT